MTTFVLHRNMIDPAHASENPYNEDTDRPAFAKQLKCGAVTTKDALKPCETLACEAAKNQ